jgi:hypothetical protein
MLSTWGDYTIWSDKMVDGEGEEYITIIVSNGQLVWECNKLTYANIPPARKSQKWSVFLPLLLSILRGTKNVDVVYKCEFVIAESVLNLTIKEPMLKGMSLFIDLQLQLSKSQESSMRNLLVLSTGAMAKYGEKIKQLGHNNTKLVEIIDKLESQLAKVAEDKDTLQNEMMRKMCILLNNRGNEIRRLRASQKCDESDLESENCEKKHLNQDRNSPQWKSIQGTSSSSSSLQQDDKLLKSNDLCPNANNMMSSQSLKSFKVPRVVESADFLRSLSQEISQSQSDIVKPNIRSSSHNNFNDSKDYKSSSSSSRNDSNGNNSSSSSMSNSSGITFLDINLNRGSKNATKNKKKFPANSDDEVDTLKSTNTTGLEPKKRKKRKMGDYDSDSDSD